MDKYLIKKSPKPSVGVGAGATKNDENHKPKSETTTPAIIMTSPVTPKQSPSRNVNSSRKSKGSPLTPSSDNASSAKKKNQTVDYGATTSKNGRRSKSKAIYGEILYES